MAAELSYKLLVNQADDRVIGAHFVVPDAGELMQGVAVAMNAGATKRVFDATLGIHPTLAEEFVTLVENSFLTVTNHSATGAEKIFRVLRVLGIGFEVLSQDN